MDNDLRSNDPSDVILREWRNSNDEEYGWHLLNLLADILVDDKGKTILGFLIFPLGTIFGLWVPSMFAGHQVKGDTSDFYAMIFCLAGGGGIFYGFMASSTKISWPQLLKSLAPSVLDASKLIRSRNFALVVICLILLGLGFGAITSLLVLGMSLSIDFLIAGQTFDYVLGLLLIVFMFVGFVFGWIVGEFIFQKLGVLVGVYCGISFVVADIIVVNSVTYIFPTVANMFDPGNDDMTLTSTLQMVKAFFFMFLSFSGLFWTIPDPKQPVKPVVGRLSRAIHKNVFAHRGWWSWWQNPPAGDELENALRDLTRKGHNDTDVWQKTLKELEITRAKPNTIKDLLDDLQSTAWYQRFAARQILREIKRDQQLNDIIRCIDSRLCLKCFYRHEAQLIALSLREQFVNGSCRNCADSNSYMTWPSEVTVILDRSQDIRFIKREDEFRVNWLHHFELFDFDKVNILDATDEDVERFAVQVGNDTDEIRGPKYKQMRCEVAQTCELSDNTLRILQQTFGEVVRAA